MKARAAALIPVAVILMCEGCASTPWESWKADLQTQLEAGSLIAATSRGPIEYAIEGSGPVVLALHGSMGGYDTGLVLGRLFGEAVAETSEPSVAGITLLSVSRPGYLRTPLEVGASTAEQADAMVALLDGLGIDSVAVAGGSGGGPVALQFGLRHPERCWGLILLCSVYEQRDLKEFPPMQRLLLRTAFTDRNSYTTVRRLEKHPERIVAGMNPITAARLQEDPRLMEMAVQLMQTSFPMSLRKAGTYNDMRSSQSIPFEQLGNITVPTMIMNGTEDEWAPVEMARKAAAEIPGARLVEFEGADHLFFLTHIDKFSEEAARFIAEHAPRE